MSDYSDVRILIVDDDESLLAGLRRRHRKRYAISTACGPQEGLKLLEDEEPFAVIVSDYQMPGMDGVSFLRKGRDLCPESIRIMLTGNAQYDDAIDAVNRGQIFRFLTKPCPEETFTSCLDQAIDQYRLLQAEKVLLEQTLRGSVQVLTETLSLANPVAFGKATRIHGYVRHIVKSLELDDAWQYETAALLSQMGCVATPQEVLHAADAGQDLTPEQQEIIDRQPQIAHDLIIRIPRLEPVAEMILAQTAGPSKTDPSGAGGGQILAVAIAFDTLVSRGMKAPMAVLELKKDEDRFDAHVVDALRDVELPESNTTLQCLQIADLRIGMIIDEDIKNANGTLVVAHGHAITQGTLERLHNHAQLGTIADTIRVRVPTPTLAVEPL